MRTAEELSDRLSQERIWRIKEITTVTSLASRSQLSPVELEFYCRAGVAIFYSHWEGFVKRASTYYLKFISYQRLPVTEMSDFVIGLYMSQSLKTVGDNTLPTLADILIRNNNHRPKLNWKEVVSTEGNLSSTVIRKIMKQIGLDITLFESKEKMIDLDLKKNRNAIAHGDKGDINLTDLVEIGNSTITLITMFRDAIENAAVQKSYRRATRTA